MPQIEAKSKVLESDQQALLGDEPVVDEEAEEFVDLEDDATESDLEKPEKKEQKPAAKKPAAEQKPAAKKEDAAAGDDEIPVEYRGKSPKEIIRMHQEAQQLIGRQGSELGDFRKKADLLIQASLANIAEQRAARAKDAPAKPAAEEIDDSAVFAKPVDAISKLIANHPAIKEIREKLGNTSADRETERATRSAEKFNETHPDAPEILQNPDFQKWVGSSRVRMGLMQRAHTKYDYEAGHEVFSTWKELQAAKAPKKEEADAAGDGAASAASEAGRALAAAKKTKREQALKDAAAPTGGGGSESSGKKKIYRRADVLRLMEEQPQRYEQMADEIALAYKEKRVR